MQVDGSFGILMAKKKSVAPSPPTCNFAHCLQDTAWPVWRWRWQPGGGSIHQAGYPATINLLLPSAEKLRGFAKKPYPYLDWRKGASDLMVAIASTIRNLMATACEDESLGKRPECDVVGGEWEEGEGGEYLCPRRCPNLCTRVYACRPLPLLRICHFMRSAQDVEAVDGRGGQAEGGD